MFHRSDVLLCFSIVEFDAESKYVRLICILLDESAENLSLSMLPPRQSKLLGNLERKQLVHKN